MHTIITHPGSAHRDDFLACCIMLAEDRRISAILRREPTAAELEDHDVCVIDIGGQYDPGKNNYDHHQFSREEAQEDPRCAVTLVLPAEFEPRLARKIWKWLEFTEMMDCLGPHATARRLGCPREALLAAVSPIETTVLRMFSQQECVFAASDLGRLMCNIGSEKLEYYKAVAVRWARLDEGVELHACHGLIVADVRCIPADEEPVMGLEGWLEEWSPEAAVTITHDDRGPGLSLFRRNDTPGVDFSRLEGQEGVTFAHKSGFVAKIAQGLNPVPFIELAIVRRECLTVARDRSVLAR